MKRPILWLIKAYQLALSPFLGQCCRYHPSCSVYAIQAIERHGVFHGIWLSIKRIGRCHPWCEGGDDPVPPLECQHSKRHIKRQGPRRVHV